MELGKVPPHDDEAEQAVIGSMMTDKVIEKTTKQYIMQ